jgi:hypothetical protein
MLNLLRLYIRIGFNFSLERLKQKNNGIDIMGQMYASLIMGLLASVFRPCKN